VALFQTFHVNKGCVIQVIGCPKYRCAWKIVSNETVITADSSGGISIVSTGANLVASLANWPEHADSDACHQTRSYCGQREKREKREIAAQLRCVSWYDERCRWLAQ